MRKKRKRIFLEVTMTKVYTWEEGEVNGWTTEEIIHDWFKRFGLSTHEHHVTRRAHEIGGATRFIDAKEISLKDWKKRVEEMNHDQAQIRLQSERP